jgi:hypothetical protein
MLTFPDRTNLQNIEITIKVTLTGCVNNALVQVLEKATVNQVLTKTPNIYGNQKALSEEL